MNVSLAAQVVSSRVADTLQYLKNIHLKEFGDADATIEFICMFDRLFDIMNARSKFGEGFKAPMTLKNRRYWEPFFQEARDYIKTLTCDGQNILHHRRKTFALGFYANTISYKMLAIDLLVKEKFLYFLPYKTSQDHQELTFSCIRSAGRHNTTTLTHCS